MSNDNADFEQTLSSGISAFEAKHFSHAQLLLAPLADKGNAEAQYRMAIMCQNGLGMVVKQEQAFEFMRDAAEQGHALAQHGLGFMYFQGECVEKNGPEAAKWFLKAAAQGLQGSMTTLAMMYAEGNGVEQDHQEARRLFEQAGFSPEDFC